MKKEVKSLASIIVGSVFLFAATQANAQISPRTLRVAYANGEGNPQHEGAKRFAELVSQKSGKKITVKLFPNATLGKDIAVLSSMQGGTIDMGIMYTSLLVGNAKECGLVQLPYIFNSDKEVFDVLDGPVGKKIHAAMEPRGIIGLGYYGFGFVHMISNKHPINTAEDFKGQKLRVTETPINISFINDLGGNAVPIPYAELYTAFEQKIIDGGSQPVINLQFARFYEVVKYLSLTRHSYEPQSFLFGKKSWDKLSADEKKIITESFEESKVFQRELASNLEKSSIEFVKSKGMVVNEVDQAEIDKMKETLKPMTEKFSKEYDEALAQEMFAEIEKIRGSN